MNVLWFLFLFCIFTSTWLIIEFTDNLLNHLDELAKYERDVEEIW